MAAEITASNIDISSSASSVSIAKSAKINVPGTPRCVRVMAKGDVSFADDVEISASVTSGCVIIAADSEMSMGLANITADTVKITASKVSDTLPKRGHIQ